ncbi:hypothetical protein Q5H93_11045 [Hymenobacter sp. ASUV-10]|uniref:Outer membrane protein beta-barrel domain-containing protein n=1 Tax=Hymenobacter aranciens TaxID=3063996 RepID=A0ABT9BAH4_9BACT|nr:hypothetical protein [Hymenobacter sp. ASUV-10]MDO7875270.1 hypothetical protein [Hymenobacter sp. ASUV-10]
MSANPIDSTNTDKPTGSLEDLFRHHLAEAAVPPRAMVWEQIDNSLLQRQNEQYRRRLTATRWVAAASIAIATLAGTGWWATHDALEHDRADLAAVTRRIEVAEASKRGKNAGSLNKRAAEANPDVARSTAAGKAAVDRATQAGATNLTATGYAAAATSASAGRAIIPTGSAVSAGSAGTPGGQSRSNASLGAASTATGRHSGSIASQFNKQAAASTPMAALAATGASKNLPGQPAGQLPGVTAGAATTSALANAGANTGIEGLTSSAARNAVAASVASTSATATGSSFANRPSDMATNLNNNHTMELALLASRTTALNLADATALPTSFATVEVPADGTPPATPPARKWQFGASYAAGVFNPNINFSRTGGAAEFDYNPALGPNSPALSEAAAAEYRDNLRPGFSQRLAVRATRRLGGRLALSTGVEMAQQQASSASSLAFVGEQVPDFGQSPGGPMRTTNFRYQTASVPVELRYTDPVKRGLSLYGRVGAAVSALLGVRAKVEGIPEATRSYSIAAEGPYRRVLANVRGGVGAQYRPTVGHWTVSLGPTAEIGLVSLNAHPAQGLAGQSRAYSLGLEASMEFGRAAK